MNWKSIRLELGSTAEFPAGSVSRAFLLRLPLNDEDVVDHLAVAQAPARATVRRHWSTEPDERGTLIPSNRHWAIRCSGRPDRILELDGKPVRLGQRILVRDSDGKALPFKVASVR